MIRKIFNNINIYQRVLLFAFIMSFLWLVVELISFYSLSYIFENPKVIYNTFAKRQAVWIMTGGLIGFYIFKDK